MGTLSINHQPGSARLERRWQMIQYSQNVSSFYGIFAHKKVIGERISMTGDKCVRWKCKNIDNGDKVFNDIISTFSIMMEWEWQIFQNTYDLLFIFSSLFFGGGGGGGILVNESYYRITQKWFGEGFIRIIFSGTFFKEQRF